MATIPHVRDVERQGEWVSVRNNPHGFSSDELNDWRKHGCPFIPGRRTLRAKKLRVRLKGQRGPKEIWFYHRPTLGRVSEASKKVGKKRGTKPYSVYPQHWKAATVKAQWESLARFTDSTGTWLILSEAALFLKCKGTTVWRWSRTGCSYLNGRKPTSCLRATPFARTASYYLLTDLEEIQRNRSGVSNKPAEPWAIGTEAAELAGVSVLSLPHFWRTGKLSSQLVMVNGKDGRLAEKRTYLRTDLIALKKAAAAILPATMITVRAAANRLGVSPATIKQWCRIDCPYIGRPIAKEEGRVPTSIGARPAWLIAKGDIESIRKALRNGPPLHVDERGTWLAARPAAKRLKVSLGTFNHLAAIGRFDRKRIAANDRWTRNGGRWVYLESSLTGTNGTANGHAAALAPPAAGPEVRAVPTPTTAANGHASAGGQPRVKRRRGRVRGWRDLEVAQQRKAIAKALREQQFDTITAFANHFGVDRRRIYEIKTAEGL